MSKYYSSSIAFGAEQTKTEKVVVSPTKIGDVTTDAVSGALTVDEVPTLDSLNPVSSDGVARAVIQAGAELPTRGSTDTGKVLTVANSDGDLEWDEPAEELPDMAGNDGKLLGAVDNNGTMEARWVNPPDSYPTVAGNANKVLTVNSGATGVEWANVPTELPSIAGNASKVLKVNDGATAVEWADESKELPNASSADNGKVLGVTDTSGTLDWVAQTPAQVNADWNSSSGVSEILNKPTIPTVDQNYNAASTNAQSGVAVAQAIADISVDEVPTVGSTDDGKVLTASYSGGQGSYSWQTAQGGGGGGGGGASYTAGQGIAIDGNNAISVDASSRDFAFGQRSTLTYWSTKYNFKVYAYPNSSLICTKDSYIDMAIETGNVHIVCDNTGSVAGNYAVCNTNYAFSNWRLTSDVKIEVSKTASDWTFTGNTFNIDDGVCYITIAGTTGSTITPNGETPVELADFFGTARFDIITNPNQLSLKNSIPTVDQSYSASSTHAQSGTAVAQAISQAGGGITWSKISGSSITTTSYSMTANFSYSIPSGKTAVQVTLMLRLSEISGSWSNIPKQLSVKLKLGDGNGSSDNYVGSIISADAWGSGWQPTVWMVSGTVVVPRDWFTSIDGITLELPMSTSSFPSSYSKDLFVGIA